MAEGAPPRRNPSGEAPPRVWSLEAPGSGLSPCARLSAPGLVVFVGVMLAAGVCMIASATLQTSGKHYFQMQIVWILLGIAGCVLGSRLPLDFLYRRSHWWMLILIGCLGYLSAAAIASRLGGTRLLAFFPLTASVKGAVRWFRLGPVQIQPSEFAKVAMVIFLAAYYGNLSRARMKGLGTGVLLPLAFAGSLLALIFLGKDLSTTVVTGATLLGVMFLAGVRMRWLLVLLLLGGCLGVLGIAGSPMRRNRIVAWRHPEEAQQGESFQLFRSQICLGIGGFAGLGYGQGYMKTYLPEPHTDFIVAVIGEEMGFLGLLGVLGGYLCACLCILGVAGQCRRREDMLLCHGIALLIAVQSLVNVGVVSGWIPPTGVTAPFLSYGGSSVISLLFLVGLVLNVSRRNTAAFWEEVGNQRCLPVSMERNRQERQSTRR